MVAGLSEKLKMLRSKYRYSQKEVADLLELSPSIVSGYETGERTPSMEVLLKLTRLFHCSADYLLGISNTPSKTLDVSGLSSIEIHSLQIIIESMHKDIQNEEIHNSGISMD